MNYQTVLTYLNSLQPKVFRLELGPLSEACHIFSNPQDATPSVHISGTNGKGSTAAFLAAILSGSKYKTGLFTSPHLVDVRERIRIGNTPIPKEKFTKIIEKIRENLIDDRMLSYFELITLTAFIYFKEEKVDIAVYETGLGGRLDATNIITPKVAIVTPISFDHMEHLGDTLKDIAAEKCGIIKRGIPTVVAYQPPDVMKVVKHFCDETGSPLCLATPDMAQGSLGLVGDHQRQNAACAMEAAALLGQAGFKISNVERSLAETKWPGRIEVVCEKPKVILDGAHNPAGAESLASYVSSSIPREKAILLIGVLADKDQSGIMRPLSSLFREVVCVNPPSERAASPKDLAAYARSFGAKVAAENDFNEALSKLIARMRPDETLVISGSLTMVGAAKQFFDKKK